MDFLRLHESQTNSSEKKEEVQKSLWLQAKKGGSRRKCPNEAGKDNGWLYRLCRGTPWPPPHPNGFRWGKDKRQTAASDRDVRGDRIPARFYLCKSCSIGGSHLKAPFHHEGCQEPDQKADCPANGQRNWIQLRDTGRGSRWSSRLLRRPLQVHGQV